MLTEIVLEGSPRDIGKRHGELLSQRIHEILELYIRLWNIPRENIPTLVAGYRRSIEQHFPHLSDEICAIAEGSGIPEAYIFAINARTELFHDASLIECTAVGIQGKGKGGGDIVLAQNWDWANYFRGKTQMVDVRPNNGVPRMRMLIEPGMVAKIGMNTAGLGVCLNFLETAAPRDEGIPVHVLLRAILECTDYDTAERLVSQSDRASSGNYLIGDCDDHIGSVETKPDTVKLLYSSPFTTHTNSFSAFGEFCERQKKFEDALHEYMRLDKRGKISPEALKKSFRIPGVEFPVVEREGGIETLHTVIMNLSKGRFLVSEGARSDVFQLYTF